MLLLQLKILLLHILQVLQVDQVELRTRGIDVLTERVEPVECFGLDPRLRYARRRVELEAEQMLVRLLVLKEGVGCMLLRRSLLICGFDFELMKQIAQKFRTVFQTNFVVVWAEVFGRAVHRVGPVVLCAFAHVS